MLARLDQIDAAGLATHQEIAEVVQGISAVATLCTPEPTLPSVDAQCQEAPSGERPFATLRCARESETCFQPPPPVRPALPVPAFGPPAAPAVASVLLQQNAPRPQAGAPTPHAWFWVGLLWLATLGLLAGVVTAVLAHR